MKKTCRPEHPPERQAGAICQKDTMWSVVKVVYHGILVRTLSLVITSQLSSQTHYKGVQFAELIAPRIQTTSAVQSDNMFFIHIELVFVAVNTVIPTSDDDMLHPKAVVHRIQAITFDTVTLQPASVLLYVDGE